MIKALRIFILIFFVGVFGFCPSVSAANSEEELFQVAENAFADGFYDTARGYVEELFSRFPQTGRRVPAKLIQGQCYFFQSQYLKAYDAFSELLVYNEYKDATLYWIGETLYKGGDHKKAIEYYRQLLEVYPQSSYVPQTLYSLGWLYFDEKKWDEAGRYFSRLIGAYPKHKLSEEAFFKLAEMAFLQKDYVKAISGFGNYLDLFAVSPRRADAYFYVGEALYYQKDYLNSIVAYAKAAKDSSDDHLRLNAEIGLGWAYLQLEKFQMAEEAFRQAENTAENIGEVSEDILLGQGKLYSQIRQNSRALEAYQKLIDGFPPNARTKEAYLGKANLQYQLADYRQAVKSYQDIISGFPDDVELVEKARFGLAWSYLKMGDIDISVKTFLQIKETSKNRIIKVSALTQVADAYHDAGEYQKALAVYDEILKDYADEEQYIDYVQYRQGISLLRLNQLEAAALSFQTLEANFPGSEYVSDAKYYLGLAYYKKGDWLSARKYILDYLSGYPKAALIGEARYVLGMSQFNLKDYAEALKTFRRIAGEGSGDEALIPGVEFRMAQCYDGLGQKDEALKRFNVVYHKYADLDVAQEALQATGDLYVKLKRIPEAVETYQELIRRFPKSPVLEAVYYNLGQIYISQQEFGKAVEMLKNVTPEAPGELYGRSRLMIADIFSEDMDSSSAAAICRNILETSPEFQRDAYMKLGDLYKTHLNDNVKALESYQKALAAAQGLSHIENAEVQFSIGDMYELMNQKDKAVEEYLKISYLYPQYVPWVVKSFLRAARIFEDQGRRDEASAIYRKIIGMKVEESKFAQERLNWINQRKQN